MAGAAAMNNKMSFNEAWPILQEEAINKLIHNLEVLEESQLNSQCFTSHDYMRLYTLRYDCVKFDRAEEHDRKEVVLKIDREREGEQIDQAMLKEVMDMYEEMDNNSVKEYYAKGLEEAIIEGTATFYSKKALNWISNNSYENYMLKVVQHELLTVYASKLEEKKHLHLLANVRDEEINLSNKLLISYTSMQ
ncbi:hypothetical protein BUALT_Bualt14G0070600 [Buddleja alternifolia]|uniref:Cullin N-terminal domain-containing protein n=1 Tax=Buddleja alternifolia TaxID=168488 RepID=A0AAV6WSK7_9LAMI|nr:hypothetical protein BUALT_Bualt14G0070600 [Buddleja alternifolia]